MFTTTTKFMEKCNSGSSQRSWYRWTDAAVDDFKQSVIDDAVDESR